MRATRCPCGVLASFKRPCTRCGRSLHLSHGHPPDEDPDHFENIEHEWYYSGGDHRNRDLPPHEWEHCPYVHVHPEPFLQHRHRDDGVAIWFCDECGAITELGMEHIPHAQDCKHA